MSSSDEAEDVVELKRSEKGISLRWNEPIFP